MRESVIGRAIRALRRMDFAKPVRVSRYGRDYREHNQNKDNAQLHPEQFGLADDAHRRPQLNSVHNTRM